LHKFLTNLLLRNHLLMDAESKKIFYCRRHKLKHNFSSLHFLCLRDKIILQSFFSILLNSFINLFFLEQVGEDENFCIHFHVVVSNSNM